MQWNITISKVLDAFAQYFINVFFENQSLRTNVYVMCRPTQAMLTFITQALKFSFSKFKSCLMKNDFIDFLSGLGRERKIGFGHFLCNF